MLIPKLAIRNILGAGLRTWLNVIVLSFTYVAIIFNQGFYYGLSNQVGHAKMEAELGGGQFWHHKYDPYDPVPTIGGRNLFLPSGPMDQRSIEQRDDVLSHCEKQYNHSY